MYWPQALTLFAAALVLVRAAVAKDPLANIKPVWTRAEDPGEGNSWPLQPPLYDLFAAELLQEKAPSSRVDGQGSERFWLPGDTAAPAAFPPDPPANTAAGETGGESASPNIAAEEDTEWVQLVIEGHRLPLAEKFVGKIIPRPPVTLRPQGTPRLSNRIGSSGSLHRRGIDILNDSTQPIQKVATEQRTGFQDWIWEPSLGPAGKPESTVADTAQLLEVPSRVELVVHIDTLQKGAPVLYAFRWGKPSTWTEYDYLLEAREEGVYVVELQEPLLFPSRAVQPLRPAARASTGGSTLSYRSRRVSEKAPSENPRAFQRLEGGAGCRTFTFADTQETAKSWSAQLNPAWNGSMSTVKAQTNSIKTRKAAVPLYYTIQFSPPRGTSSDGLGPMSFMQHSLCLVFSGTPSLQIFSLEGLEEPAGQTSAAEKTSQNELRFFEEQSEGYLHPEVHFLSDVPFGREVGTDKGGKLGNMREMQACTNISQLPVLEGEFQALSLLHGPYRGRPTIPSAAPAKPLHALSAEVSASATSVPLDSTLPQLHLASAAGECATPYSDYVYFSEPLAFSRRAFNPEKARAFWSKAWRRPLPSADEVKTPEDQLASSETATESATYDTKDATPLQQFRGRQLLQEPSVTFLWRQLVLLQGEGTSSRDKRETSLTDAMTESLWDILSRGQSPCVLLGFRSPEGSIDPPAGPALDGATVTKTSNDFTLNSCKALAAATKRGLLTPEALTGPQGVSWLLPKEVLPSQILEGAGSVVYHVQLIVPVSSTSTGPSDRQKKGASDFNRQAHRATPQQLAEQRHPDQSQNGQLWVLQQGLEVREPAYGEWFLSLRRLSKDFPGLQEQAKGSAADFLALYVIQRSCRTVLAEAKRRLGKKMLHHTERASLGAVRVPRAYSERTKREAQHHHAPTWRGAGHYLETQKSLPEIYLGSFPKQAGIGPSGSRAVPCGVESLTDTGGVTLEDPQLVDLKRDCNWCSQQIAAFTPGSALYPQRLQLTFKLGSPSIPGEASLLVRPAEARRLDTAADTTLGGDSDSGSPAEAQWRAVGSPVFSSLSLTPATASGGRSLSVTVDFVAFAASRTRRCAPFLHPLHTEGPPQLGSRRLYFYALAVQVTRDAVPQQPVHWGAGLQETANPAAFSRAVDAHNSTTTRKGLVRLPVFCEDPEDSADDLQGAYTAPSVVEATLQFTGSPSWIFKSEILPPDFDMLPTTYLLQWQLLEGENYARTSSTNPLSRAQKTTVPMQSDADVSLHVVAASDVSSLCSKHCPPRGSCAITGRLDGFAVFGCRCAYGFTGADCESEYMNAWMRTLAQGALVLSNVAMLPSFLLCLRLAVRHLNIPGNSAACDLCKINMHHAKSGQVGIWQAHSCFILYLSRAFAYFNAFLWSALYHSCVDASARLPMEVPVLQSLDFVFSYYALFVTALALTNIGCIAAELLAHVAILLLLSFKWLPETFDQQSASWFVITCVMIPFVSVGVRALALWKQCKEAEARQLQLEAPLRDWRPEDIRWLEGRSDAGEEIAAPPEADDMHPSHHELQQLLRQKMERARERMCLKALGQAVARLEVARKVHSKLCCCTADPRMGCLQSLLYCLKTTGNALLPGVAEPASTMDSSNIVHGYRAPSDASLSWVACLGVAATRVSPHLEFLGLGVLLATLGIGCVSVEESSDDYWLMHSLWHICIQSATCFVLMSTLQHPIFLELSDPKSLLLSRIGPEVPVPSRSLSEAISAVDELQVPASTAQGHLTAAFWRVLHHNQMRSFALHSEPQGSYDDIHGGPQLERPVRGDSQASFSPLSFHSLLSASAASHNLELLLPVFTRLLVIQFSVHKKNHRRRAIQEPQASGGDRGVTAVADKEPGMLRTGTATTIADETTSPQSASPVSPASSVSSDMSEWGCLWCVARVSLGEQELLQIHGERLRAICRLRLMPIRSCCFLPRWLWDPAESHMSTLQTDVRTPQGAVLLCS
ncbi:hypothetical protein cyc_03519 [Cyclospora cayetanensis]|uniref:EGF-like domain-containing protein n=1 Tax=Cyclospora cayetanensis TaxID=88456 RepID=A0A1D3CRU0_9EIME|nr:hypothetical protein cyc_03519 [Cyclospora cayetanensis]